MKNNYLFMAMSKGAESIEGSPIKRYIGVAPVYILAVNPNKTELEKLYNTTLENAPEYISEVDRDDKKVQQVRLDFIIKTDAEKCGIEFTNKISFFITKEFRFNKDKTKVQVIDKYGRTAWVTKEQLNVHEIPTYSNGPANLDADYRACYVGEEQLTEFIKTYLNIPNVMKYVNKTWVMNDNTQDSEARLESIESYFKGNFSEVKDAISFQPNNKIKLMFGIKTTDDNKQYQTVYTQMFLRNSVTDYSKLNADLQERKANGAFATTEFAACNLKEYVITPTNFTNTNDDGDLPFGSDTASNASNPW